AVDWDGDGRFDLLTGSENGGVYWYRNVGEPGKPVFEAERVLVPPHDGSGEEELLLDDAQARPGIRSQIAVTAVDGDGKLDLLVGDFCTTVSPRADVTAAQRAQLIELERRSNELGKQIALVEQQAEAIWRPWADKNIQKDAWAERDSQDRIRDAIAKAEAEVGIPALNEQGGALHKEIEPLLAPR